MTEDGIDDLATRVLTITESIKPMLAGQGSEVQSAVLANLTALWLAGHFAERGTAADTAKIREQFFDFYIALVRDLVEPSEREILDLGVDRAKPQ